MTEENTEYKEKNFKRNSKLGIIATALITINSFSVNAQENVEIKGTINNEHNNPKDKKEIVVETDKKGNIRYSVEDTSDKYYVSAEEFGKTFSASKEEGGRQKLNSEELKKMSKEERDDYFRGGENEGLNFKSIKSDKEKEGEIKETFLEKWFSKKGKEKKNIETNYVQYETSSKLGEIFNTGKYTNDVMQTSIDKREVNLYKNGIPKGNTYTTFRHTMQNGISERLNPVTKLLENVDKREYRRDWTLKKQDQEHTEIKVSRDKKDYEVTQTSLETKLRKDGETIKKQVQVRYTETKDTSEDVKTVTSYRKDGTIKRIQQMYEDLKGKKKIVGRFAKDGEQIGDFKDKSTEFSEKKVKSNVEEQKSKGNQGMEIIKAAKDNGRN